MNEHKRVWLLARMGRIVEDIVDCDPDTERVTMADGRQRQICEVFTRVIGYHRPVHMFNAGKQAEHRDRLYFIERPGDLDSALECD